MLTKEHLDVFFGLVGNIGPEEAIQYDYIRKAAHQFARVVLENTPGSADQTTAIRKIRESLHSAADAIAQTPHLPRVARKTH